MSCFGPDIIFEHYKSHKVHKAKSHFSERSDIISDYNSHENMTNLSEKYQSLALLKKK